MNEHYIDPVEWLKTLDEIASELQRYEGPVPADRLSELTTYFIDAIRPFISWQQLDFTHALRPFISIELCVSQMLSLIDRYFSLRDIANILQLGLLRFLRSEKTTLYPYPKIQSATDEINQGLLKALLDSIKVILAQNVSHAECRKKMIEEIRAAVDAGMDINAQGEGGRALIHELMRLDIPMAVFTNSFTRYTKDYSSLEPVELHSSNKEGCIRHPVGTWNNVTMQCEHVEVRFDMKGHGVLTILSSLGVDWNLRDDEGCTALHHAFSREELAECILDCDNVDPFVVNHQGQGAYDLIQNNKSFLWARVWVKASCLLMSELLVPHVNKEHLLWTCIRNWIRTSLINNKFKHEARSLKSSLMLDLLVAINNYFSEDEVKELVDPGHSSGMVSIFQLLPENSDLTRRCPKFLKAVYGHATKEPFWLPTVIPFAINQVERDLDQEGLHAHIVSTALDYVQKKLWALKDEMILPREEVSLLLELLNKFSPKVIKSVLESVDAQGHTLSFYMRNKQMQQDKSTNETLLHFVCSKNYFEVAVCLVNSGADVYAETSHGKTPIEMLDWGRLSGEPIEQWKSFFDSRMGIMFENLRLLKILGISCREYLVSDSALQQRLVHPDVAQLSQADKDNLKQKAKRAMLKCHAHETGLYRRRNNTVFFGMPRDVARMIVRLANPDVVFRVVTPADNIPSNPNEELRAELIERLGEYTKRYEEDLAEGIDISETHYEALCVMRTALLDPTKENIECVQALRANYYDVCEDERFAELFKNCLAILDEDKKQSSVVSYINTKRGNTNARTTLR